MSISNSNGSGAGNNGLLRQLGAVAVVGGLFISACSIAFKSGYWAGEHAEAQRCLAEKLPLPHYFFGGEQ